MKRLNWPVILIPLLVIGLIFAVSCEEPAPTEQPDIPKYRADQVIAVASAYSPTFSKWEQARYVCEEKPAWSAEYLSQGVWMVKKYAIRRLGGEKVPIEGWYFHENNGQLNKSRY